MLCDWFGEHISLSLIGPELEVGTKYKEADQSLTSHSWTGCTEVVRLQPAATSSGSQPYL